MICSLLKYVFAGSDVNQISVKVSVQQWDLPLTINTSLNGCEWKKYEKKPLLKMFLTENEVLVDTDQNISASFVDLCSGVGIVWSTTTRTQVSDADATAITFSVKCFNPLKLYALSGNIFRKWFASYFLFIHEHLIIMWSPTVSYCCYDTL